MLFLGNLLQINTHLSFNFAYLKISITSVKNVIWLHPFHLCPTLVLKYFVLGTAMFCLFFRILISGMKEAGRICFSWEVSMWYETTLQCEFKMMSLKVNLLAVSPGLWLGNSETVCKFYAPILIIHWKEQLYPMSPWFLVLSHIHSWRRYHSDLL